MNKATPVSIPSPTQTAAPAKAEKPTAKRPAKAKVQPSANGRARKEGLRIPQIRVLHVLAKANGALSRSRISEKCGNKTTVVVGRAVGYSDPKARKAFEQTKDGGFTKSLLSLGFVREHEIGGDGEVAKETVVEMTAAGRKAYVKLGKVKLPAMRD